MNSVYKAWIDGHVTTVQAARGRCHDVAVQMQQAFPELRVARGHYWDPVSNREHPHWWVVAEDGEIVDPTACQFASGGEYREHEGPEPTGKCLHCGGLVYDHSAFCSKKCAKEGKEVMDYLRFREKHKDFA